MKFWDYNSKCDWCYKKKSDKSRFCSTKCKQAHHRAYKKYLENSVTKSRDRESALRCKSNAKKKRNCDNPANGRKAKNSFKPENSKLLRDEDGSYENYM